MGARHFPLAYQTAGHQEFAGLSAAASDLIVLLWFCVGILLLDLGILSLHFARRLKAGDRSSRVFFLCGGILCFVRALLDLKYPVTVPAPNHFVLATMVVVCLLFLIPVFITRGDQIVPSGPGL